MGKCPSESHEEGSECNTVDIHSFITKQVYHDKINVPVEKIKEVPEFNRMRSICKSVTFGLAYGGTAVGLANSTGIPLEEAKDVVELYFNTFPAIKEYIEKAQKYVDEHGEIIDMVGRKRKFHYAGWGNEAKANAYYLHDERTHELKDRFTIDLNWEGEKYWKKTGFKKGNDEFRSKIGKDLRAGINFPIQGLAASMTKIAATELYNEFKKHPEWDAKIIQFIHDEVLVHCKKTPDIIRKVIAAITDCMVNRINMPAHCLKNQPLGWSWPSYLPMSVEAEVGDSYGAIMDPEKYIASFEEEYKAAHQEPEKVDIEELVTEDEDETDWTADETGDWKNMAMLTGKVEDVPEGASVQKEKEDEKADIEMSEEPIV